MRIINHYHYNGSKFFTWNHLFSVFLFLSIIGLIACSNQSKDDISSETPATTEPMATTKPETSQNPPSNQSTIAKPTPIPTPIATPLPTAKAKPTTVPTSVPTAISKTISKPDSIEIPNIVLRVVRVTPDWMPFRDTGGWTSAVRVKESEVLKNLEVAIWEETSSVHLYAFPNDYNPGYGYNPRRTDQQSIAYREQFLIEKYVEMPPSDSPERSTFLKSTFKDISSYLVDQYPNSDHHLIYSGHGGPGGALFGGQLYKQDAYSVLQFWSQSLGKKLGVIDMGGPCTKGSFTDLENFCEFTEYYIASDMPNGGYQMDDWTEEKHLSTDPITQYHDLFRSHNSLESVLKARIDLKRIRYEYSKNNMISNQVAQANYLYSCSTFSAFQEKFKNFIATISVDYQIEDDVYHYMISNNASSDLKNLFDSVFVHKADNRDFFDWTNATNYVANKYLNGMLMPLPNSVPISTPKPKSTPTPTPTPTITAKEKLISIGYNVPIVGSVDEARQEYVASLDIPEKYRQRFIEVQENLNSVLGGYPNYIYIAYNPNGTEEDAKPVFERMAQLYPIDNNGKPFKDWTIAELINRQSCLGGADPGRGDPSKTNPYSVCLEDLDFIQTPWGEEIEHPYRSDIKMILHLGHEYFHHYQRVHALDRGLDYQADRNNPETTVQAPTWWIEGAAVAFQNAWYRENWKSLSLLKDLTPNQALSTNIATVADARVYKEARSNMMGNGNSEKCTPDWYMSSLDETYDTYTGCNATFMAAAYLAYITSYKTVWIDIPQDYYDLGFWGSFEKHVGMTKQEFYDSYNQFLRTGDPDDEPPEGWAPPANYISEHADFLKIVPESD